MRQPTEARSPRTEQAMPAAAPVAVSLVRRRHLVCVISAFALAILAESDARAQQSFGRLSIDLLDVSPPSARVAGAPGTMAIRDTKCPVLADADVRQRMVDIAVQEWAFFGFTIHDPAARRRPAARPVIDGPPEDVSRRSRRRFRWLDSEEAARVASTIAGYWAVTPEGAWILGNQNKEWSGPDGVAARWRDPWSAAFISWVACETGLGDERRFRRAVAHHVYIDQAIRAREGQGAQAAFVAYDIGERSVEPGDLLCSGRRPAYRTIAERRRQMGDGARTHCDIVVKLDEPANRILTIGGNVRGSVSLKMLPAIRNVKGELHARGMDDGGSLFAHLKLRAPSVAPDALDRAPTLKALACAVEFEVPARARTVILPAAAAAGHAECGRSARVQ